MGVDRRELGAEHRADRADGELQALVAVERRSSAGRRLGLAESVSAPRPPPPRRRRDRPSGPRSAPSGTRAGSTSSARGRPRRGGTPRGASACGSLGRRAPGERAGRRRARAAAERGRGHASSVEACRCGGDRGRPGLRFDRVAMARRRSGAGASEAVGRRRRPVSDPRSSGPAVSSSTADGESPGRRAARGRRGRARRSGGRGGRGRSTTASWPATQAERREVRPVAEDRADHPRARPAGADLDEDADAVVVGAPDHAPGSRPCARACATIASAAVSRSGA